MGEVGAHRSVVPSYASFMPSQGRNKARSHFRYNINSLRTLWIGGRGRTEAQPWTRINRGRVEMVRHLPDRLLCYQQPVQSRCRGTGSCFANSVD